MPYDLAKLLKPGTGVLNQSLAHPSMLESVDTEHFIKMLNFKIWADNKVNEKKFSNLSDVIISEIKVFEDYNFTKKQDFQVKINLKQ